MDPKEIALGRCGRCGAVFEDLALAIEETGGWCPTCEAPAAPVVTTRILTPLCPVCGTGPGIVLGGGRQAFCVMPECRVLTWNPTLGPEQVLEGQSIDLSFLERGPDDA